MPFNEDVYQELGYAHFHLAEQQLGNAEIRDRHFKESLWHFIRSIRLNPGKYQTHFLFGQALSHMNYFMDLDVDYVEEFRKASLLTYSDQKVSYEVGLFLLVRWPELSEEKREYTIRMLKDKKHYEDPEKLENILQVWASIAGDYELINRILPRNQKVYRRYAEFLGEKSLSLKERQQKLTQAELMDYEEARKEYNLGRQDLQSFRLPKAMTHFRSAFDLTYKISFYQNLTSQNLIKIPEFNGLRKSIFLGMIQYLVNLKGNIQKIKEFTCAYIALESDAVKIWDLETYLKRKKIITEDKKSYGWDMDKLFCRMALDFTQHRYSNIIDTGEFLKRSLRDMENDRETDCIKIYRMIGDSYHKQDFIYDAIEFYKKALNIDPWDVKTLISILDNYQRLNDEENIKDIQEKINEAVNPREIPDEDIVIMKGQSFDRILNMTGDKIDLTLDFQPGNSDFNPLITLFLNGKVIWEDYLTQGSVSLSLKPEVGKNTLRIVPVNQAVTLKNMTFVNRKKGFKDSRGRVKE
jgi:tetratricopeptide (TPR) repeat protein